MSIVRFFGAVLAAVLSLTGLAGAQQPVTGSPLVLGLKVVLVAGDGSLPVFDDAVAGVGAALLADQATKAADIAQFSGSGAALNTPRAATLRHVLGAIASLRPGPSQGCLVFATSHGGRGEGLWLSASHAFLTPRALDAALLKGCGDAPTVVIMSACFSGSFARPPMTRPNRVVLTAARPDRTSFGCSAGRTYTAYDQCLLGALATKHRGGVNLSVAYELIKTCVTAEEWREHAVPSEPQAWFGPKVAGLDLPSRERGMDLQPWSGVRPGGQKGAHG
jgi:hypothetical protein